VLAFQKHHGLERDGVFHAEQWQMLEEHVTIRWLPEADRIEVDIAKQVLYLVLDNHVNAVLPISSGNGRSYTNSQGGTSVATTPEGRFRFYFQRNYNHESKLGWMYKPYYFNGGFAIHGSPNVPAYPASHGCIRLTNSDMDFLRQYLEIGMPVYLYGRRTDPPEFAIESRWKAPEPT
jgi:lipoprotein-anchoring transpeptidase ErfK/SrfK